MIKKFYFLILFLCGFILPSLAFADCYRDCMSGYGCWNSMGESENVSFCSGMQATCSTQCRHQESSEKSYGAIAYSVKDGAYGYSQNWKNQKKAEKTALQYCAKSGKKCKVMVWFYNSCGAVASNGKKTGWGQDSNENSARQKALKSCGKKDCEVKVSHCSF